MHHMDAQDTTFTPDRRLAELAAGQFGVFDLEDARACGFTRGAIAHRVRTKRWLRQYASVYAPGHDRLTIEGRWLAAPDGGPRRLPPPIRGHRSSLFDERHATTLGPLPLTTVARTLVDLADGGAARARSALEVRFLALCDAYGLPRPVANATIAGREVDFHWPGTRLVVETDGWAPHRMPGRREADAAKRLALEAAGFHVVVVTWTQVTHETAATAAALLAVLQAAQAA